MKKVPAAYSDFCSTYFIIYLFIYFSFSYVLCKCSFIFLLVGFLCKTCSFSIATYPGDEYKRLLLYDVGVYE